MTILEPLVSFSMITVTSDLQRWRLPDGVEEILPESAKRLEHLRRAITDLHFSYGFDLVMPPMIEFLDSLLTGSGEFLDLQTFKLVDQLSGRTMGVRADMTPQVARIDGHRLDGETINRLFYLGTVLRTKPEQAGGTRTPLQFGAELYGHKGIESDLEIIHLMLDTLDLVKIPELTLDLGHVGVYRALVQYAGLAEDAEAKLFNALQRKSMPEITDLLASWGITTQSRVMLEALPELNGDVTMLAHAREVLGDAGTAVTDCLDTLQDIHAALHQRSSMINLHFDLAELRGYSYHTGVLFAAYADGASEELARGGRYDDIGAAFGQARAATGYSADLKQLAKLQADESPAELQQSIFVETPTAPGASEAMADLRKQNIRVVAQLPGSGLTPASTGCTGQLVNRQNQWVVESV